MPPSAKPLRLGVLGAARIARLFVAAVKPSTKVRVTAVASRDADRAAAFAREVGIERVHATYEALLADPDVDAVYVPLANSLHARWSIRAAEAGKHVLCEKPLATTAGEARAMFEAAQRGGVYLAEAYPYRAQPQTRKLRELLEQRAIGTLKTVHAAFGFPLADATNIRMDPELAGGAIMDAGSYPVSIVRMIAGAAPVRVHASSRWAPSGVDRTTVATLEFADGLLAQVSCSFETARHRHATIIGDAGSIATTYFNDTSAELPPLLHLRRGMGWDAKQEIIETPMASGFFAEAEAFHDLVRSGWASWPGTTPAESVDIAAPLEAMAASARTGAPAVVGE
jgi:D-xylose 1-dehydrogenase (NADP+, D-xylono-1,5-lactone-forming)